MTKKKEYAKGCNKCEPCNGTGQISDIAICDNCKGLGYKNNRKKRTKK